MSAIDKVLAFMAPNTAKRIEKQEARSFNLGEWSRFLAGPFTGTWAGIDIDRLTAMGLPVLWACIKVLSESLASFPLILYQGTVEGQTRKRADEHPLWDMLHTAPNPQQDAFSFYEQGQGHLCLYGNFYANIIRKGSGAKELWPLSPEKVTPFRKDGALLYRYNDGHEQILSASEVFHVHGFGFDGIRGYCPLDLQRETWGLAAAAKHYAADYFANDGSPNLVISHKTRLNDVALQRLRESFRQQHAQHGQKHKPLILEDGMTANSLGSDPTKSGIDLVSIQKFLVTEICRLYRVPPHMVQDLERATFSNIEHQSIEFVQHTMRPWVMRWESAISRQLISEKDRKQFYPEFWMEALLRGDAQTRAKVYATRIGSGQMSPNEARRREQENDREGGDTYYVPLNWVDASEPPEPKEPPAPPPQTNSIDGGESRSVRSARGRRAIANSFSILLKDSAARIVRKECHDLRKAIGNQLKRDAGTFAQWMEKYYRDIPDYVRRQVVPVYQAFSNAIRAEISSELGIDEAVTAEDEQFVRAFVDTFIKRYVGASVGQLDDIMRKAAAQDMAQLLEDRLAEWEEWRADRVALNEKTQGSNAFARNMYLLAGVTTLTWMAMGSKPCPYCERMDGTSSSIADDFVYEGEEIPPDDRGMKVGKSLGHPPLHRGCECQIVAETGRSVKPAEARAPAVNDNRSNVTVPIQVVIDRGQRKRKVSTIKERDKEGLAKIIETVEETCDGE